MSHSNTPRSIPIMVVGKKNTDSAAIALGAPVKLDTATDDGVKNVAATTDHAIGIAMTAMAVNQWGDVMLIGQAIALAGGTITRGDYVSPGTGSGVTTTTTNKDRALGQANRSAAVGELFELLVGIPATLSA